MASTLYDHAKKLLLSGTVNFVTDRIMCMLVSGSYNGASTTALRTHRYTGDIGANEVTDPLGSYRAGGKELTSRAVGTYNETVNGQTVTLDAGVFDADDVSWSSSTITDASGAVIYQSGLTNVTSRLLAYVDFGAKRSSSNGLFQISWNSQGIVNISD